MGIIVKIVWVLGVLLWGFSVGAIVFLSTNLLPIIAVSTLTILMLLLISVIAKNANSKKQQFFPLLINQMGTYSEINLFDAHGHLLYSSKGPLYLHTNDFLRRFYSLVPLNEQTKAIQDAITNKKPLETLVSSGGNGLGQGEKWWIIRIIPYQKMLTIFLIDVSHALENHNQLKESYRALEQFVDSSPFGIFYTSRSGHFVGVNSTFANWTGLLKEQILGKRITDLIKQQDENWITLLVDPPQTLYRLHNGSAHIVLKMIPPTSQGIDAFDKAPLPAIKIGKSGVILNANYAFKQLFSDHVNVDQVQTLNELISESQRSEIMKKIAKLFESSHHYHPFEARFIDDKIHTTTYSSRIDKETLLLQFIDISEQKRLEQQFIQSQKMQAVGQLAGGIAHDFNNLLTAMLGFCDLLLQRYIPSDPSYNDVIQIKQNAMRAANLVRQLLAFSRQQSLQPKIIHISDSIAELTALLRRLIGAGIDLQVIHGRDVWPIKADASQFDQVIINIAVNARDAMGQEGKLIIRTSNYHSSKIVRFGHDMMPKGDYVLIEVEDTGHGIEAEHLDRIFDPFFSTKEVGAGTGLGLSTVYGIIKQSGGFISVETSTKQPTGTTFKIFIPRFQGAEPLEKDGIEEILPTDLSGGGKILLVEDEDAVRLFSARALRDKGYNVIEAASGEAALALIQNGEKFDLLITDVVMPKMDGPTLAKKVANIYPNLKTIFISGYAEDTFRKNLGHNAKIHFLAKPFSLKDLASKVKDVLSS